MGFSGQSSRDLKPIIHLTDVSGTQQWGGEGCAAPQSRRDDRRQARLPEAARLARPLCGSIEVGSEPASWSGDPRGGKTACEPARAFPRTIVLF